LIRKARDNHEAALILNGWPYPDAAASRLYYALYHAGWAFLVKRGHDVPDNDGRRYFRHEQMDRQLEEEQFGQALGLDEDWQECWSHLWNLRRKADYYPDSVDPGDLDDILFGFVGQVIGQVAVLR
jgi:uncharacterized protein (UPF0332 family)